MSPSRPLRATWLVLAALPVQVASWYSQPEAIKFAHLSGAAYCPSVAPAWKCGVHCEQVPGMSHVRRIDDNRLAAHAYVGRLGGLCVVAFRGTDSVRAWAQDLRSMHLRPLPGCSFHGRRCEVGSGFYSDYRALAGGIQGGLAAIGCHKSSHLALTGHSQGAALATLAAFDLQRRGYRVVKSYTFGQPRLGNAAFAGAFNRAMRSRMYRVSRADDPIVYLPPRGPWHLHHLGRESFHHVGREVYYPGESWAGYRLCNGSGEDRRCSGRYTGAEVAGMLLSCLNDHTCGHLNYLRPAMRGMVSSHSCRRRLSNSSEQALAPSAQAPAGASSLAAPATSAPAAEPTPAPAIIFP